MANTFHRYKPGAEPVAGYHVSVCLGAGGFGEVWKGMGPGGTEVAVKIIDLTGQQGVQEFQSLRLVKTCAHPNLVPIHAFWLKDEEGNVVNDESREAGGEVDTQVTGQFVKPVELIIVMGLGKKCLNKRLREVRDEGLVGIPPGELLDYMEGSARGIDYLNTQIGIVHGDIKPHNILVVGDAAAVCDFGLARAVESLRKTSMAPMTVAYAAPESFRGKPTIKSDQYSLAISYIELRTGRLPFDEGLAPFDLMNAHVTGQLDLMRLPPYEREVIRRALALNPDDRWNSNRDFVRALTKAHEADPQGKLLPGAPFDEDLSASGFVATLTADSHGPGSEHSEFNRQTRGSLNHGVTPRHPPGTDHISSAPTMSASTFAADYVQSPDDDLDAPTTVAAPVAKKPLSRAAVLISAGVAVVVLAAIAVGVWMSAGRGDKLSPAEALAQASDNIIPLTDRLVRERQFKVAISELEKLEQLGEAAGRDPATKTLVAQRREQVRAAWVAFAEQSLQEKRVSEAQRQATDILRHFPGDVAATKVLEGKAPSTPVVVATPPVESQAARILREADAATRAGRWVDALDRLEAPSRSLSAEEAQQVAERAAKVRQQWLAAVRATSDSGNVTAAMGELQAILKRYPTMQEARAQRIRGYMAQSSFTAARGDLDELKKATNLPPEGLALRDALSAVIDLRTRKSEPIQLYPELLKLKNIDAPAAGGPWDLLDSERELLRSTRDKLLDDDFASLVAGSRKADRMPLAEKLLAHMPAKRFDLLLIKSEIQVEAGQPDDARQSIDEAEKTLQEVKPAQAVDFAARRLIVDLRDDRTDAARRTSLIAEAEKSQAQWSPPRRLDLGAALVALTKKFGVEVEPAAMRIIHAAIKLEPAKPDLYRLVQAMRGDEWNPRVVQRMNDPARPTPEQWQQLFEDCTALKVLTAWTDNRTRAICAAARAEAMCELGMKLDADALDVIDLGNGWPSEGYIYYVGARVAWETDAPADKVEKLVSKALGVRQIPPQLNAPFRKETIDKMRSGAPRGKRVGKLHASPDADALALVFADPNLAEQEQACRALWERSGTLAVPARIAAWDECARMADALARHSSDATVERIAGECHEHLAATARLKPAEHFQRAVEAYSRWIDRAPVSAAYTSRARVYIRFLAFRGAGLDPDAVFQIDRFQIGDRCESDLARAIELDAADSEPHRWLGRLKREQADARGADKHFARAIELARPLAGVRLVDALRDWAENALLLEQYDEALRRCDALTEGTLPPELLPRVAKVAAALRGETLYRQRHWQAAIAAFDRAVEPGDLAAATIDDLPLLLHRAEARRHIKHDDPAATLRGVDQSLADLAQALLLAPDAATRAEVEAASAQHALRGALAAAGDPRQAAKYRQRGLAHTEHSLRLVDNSADSVTVRVVRLKLLLSQLTDPSAGEVDKRTRIEAARLLFSEARSMSEQQQLATELGELLKLEIEHAGILKRD